jgi:hypothetical protein
MGHRCGRKPLVAALIQIFLIIYLVGLSIFLSALVIMTDEQKLIEKLRLIEALHSGGATEGERQAAGLARERILARLRVQQQTEIAVEYTFTMRDTWSRKLLVALLRRYDIRPYRYARQRYTTVMARVPKKFVDEVLWPEFQECNKTLNRFLDEVTERVISASITSDKSDVDVVSQPTALPHPQNPQNHFGEDA